MNQYNSQWVQRKDLLEQILIVEHCIQYDYKVFLYIHLLLFKTWTFKFLAWKDMQIWNSMEQVNFQNSLYAIIHP